MINDTFQKLTVADVAKIDDKEQLTAIALDKRQDDEVRLEAIARHRDGTAMSELVHDMDNSPEIREAARGTLATDELIALGMTNHDQFVD